MFLAMTMLLAVSPAKAQPTSDLLTDIPVTGALEDGGTFEGTLSLTELALDSAGNLVASGVLNGTATDAAGIVTDIVDQAFQVTANLTQDGNGGRCDILFLDLGPIFLDLLGLEVDLSRIVLDIDAVRGAGNLLGNLLCAVAGLLDGGPTSGLSNLLNRITSILG